ncbi:MAG: phospho-sugar mutase [Oscillospiraceae bacterium]|nr:phospho-sugar mutase [Oscillospiraceae bacterium]
MDAAKEYALWLEKVTDPRLVAELNAIAGDENAIKNRFGAELSFGTAGMRGVLEVGTNRMNIHTVRRATQGLADYVNDVFGEGSIAVSYDSRNYSEEFAQETAKVLAANGVKVYLYDRLMPVPMLSFAVRELGCKAGVMITASHNPAEYNGYKVYGSDGCQMTDDDADAVLRRINNHDYFDTIKTTDLAAALESGLVEHIPPRVVEAFYEQILKQRVSPDAPAKKGISIVYTPLNGAGNEPVRRVLDLCGHKNVTVVPEQELPDGDFPTCPYPNPEMAEARALGLALCEQVKPDIFIATDPDADRVGVAFPEKDGSYRSLTGNEAGILMLDYIIRSHVENGTMPKNPVAVRSIVSSALADEIAAQAGVEIRVVLTGFKYIGEQILLLEQAGEEERFIFGFEESCGYLSGGYVRDKDGVFAAMLLCELTSYYLSKKTTPLEVLEGIYKKYGYYRHRVANIAFPGLEGGDQMKAVTARLRETPPTELAGFAVVERDDLKTLQHLDKDGNVTPIKLPVSDVLCYTLENGARVIVRPSGTEPKMKIYISAKESTPEASDALAEKLEAATRAAAGIA